jgi:hypothetical protein
MNTKKVIRKTVSAKKNKVSQGMPRDAATPSVSESSSTPTPFSRRELQEIGIQISASWFRAPEVTRLTLMEVHPWRLHAYWNIAEADMAAARASQPADAEEPSLVVRFTDLSTTERGDITPDYSFDIEIQGLRNDWYVDLWQDGRRYSAQLGLRTTNGDIISLARSNEVALPRATPSSALDFKQLEVRTPLPLDLNVLETALDHDEHLLQNLFPKRHPLNDEFPELAPEVSDIQLDEPEYPALLPAADALAYSPVPLQSERELIDFAHTSPVPIITEETEFPQIETSKDGPYSIQAQKEKARLLADAGIELPPVAEETISLADVDLTPQPLPLFKREPELPHSTLSSEPALESSTQVIALDTSEAQPPAPGSKPELMQEAFPEVMPNRDTHFTEHEFPVPIAETGARQSNLTPLEFQGEVAMVNMPQAAQQFMAEASAPEQSTIVSGPAPRPVIALEEVLSNAFFSYGRGDSSKLELTAELHLHGKLESDNVLSLFGEQVHVDAQGGFSVRLKLERGPTLSTLLYGQRNRIKDHS